MSERQAEVRMLSGDTWALSARWSRGAHVSKTGEAHFQISGCFINKPQILVLNNHILVCNTFKTVCVCVCVWGGCVCVGGGFPGKDFSR